jgi:RNAse (barnase) inhibitor barstar
MQELLFDAAYWNCSDDFYDDFFRAVGAPEWHGRNFDALNDSISAGSINAVEVPYRVIIRNYDLIGPGAARIASDFIDLIHEIAARGCPVEIRTENSNQ